MHDLLLLTKKQYLEYKKQNISLLVSAFIIICILFGVCAYIDKNNTNEELIYVSKVIVSFCSVLVYGCFTLIIKTIESFSFMHSKHMYIQWTMTPISISKKISFALISPFVYLPIIAAIAYIADCTQFIITRNFIISDLLGICSEYFSFISKPENSYLILLTITIPIIMHAWAIFCSVFFKTRALNMYFAAILALYAPGFIFEKFISTELSITDYINPDTLTYIMCPIALVAAITMYIISFRKIITSQYN